MANNLDNCYSSAFVENVLNSLNDIPDDIQKNVSQITEIDVKMDARMREFTHHYVNISKIKEFKESKEAELGELLSIEKHLADLKNFFNQLIVYSQIANEIVDSKHSSLNADYDKFESCGKEAENAEPHESKEKLFLRPELKRGRRRDATATNAVKEPKEPSGNSSATTSSSTSLTTINSANNSPPSTSMEVDAPEKSSDKQVESHTTSSNNNSSNSTSSGTVLRVRPASTAGATRKQVSQSNNSSSSNNVNKKRKRKSGRQAAAVAAAAVSAAVAASNIEELPHDVDEPTYCLCDQISYGEMICCDNDLCPIEWFHFTCVNLNGKPKGKWYCPKCRGEKQSVMKPKALFLKELERYNKEKEDA